MPNSIPHDDDARRAALIDHAGLGQGAHIHKKDLPLEALRGFAAVTVLLWHSMLGFFPQWSGMFPDQWPLDKAFNGQPWFGLIHGTAAVTLFFVLSAFVLTRRFFLSGDQDIILRGVIKRWPRLAGPVILTVLVSWMLFQLHAYRYAEAGLLTKSPWLQKFAYAYETPFDPSFWDAVFQGAFLTFFRGDSYYDSSLWTMKIEFVGSFIAFGLAVVLASARVRREFFQLFVIFVVIMMCNFSTAIFAAFPMGVGLAFFLPQRNKTLPTWVVVGLIIFGVYLFGYMGGGPGVFVVADWAFGWGAPANAHILASVMIISAVELAPERFRAPLSGRVAQFLGALSFPLYLIHVLVLCSLGSAVFMLASQWLAWPYPNIMACIATIIGAVLAALPLVYFNEHWVDFVNAKVRKLILPSRSRNADEPRRSGT